MTPEIHRRRNAKGELVHQGTYIDRQGRARFFFATLIDKDNSVYDLRIKNSRLDAKCVDRMTVSGFSAVSEYLTQHAFIV